MAGLISFGDRLQPGPTEALLLKAIGNATLPSLLESAWIEFSDYLPLDELDGLRFGPNSRHVQDFVDALARLSPDDWSRVPLVIDPLAAYPPGVAIHALPVLGPLSERAGQANRQVSYQAAARAARSAAWAGNHPEAASLKKPLAGRLGRVNARQRPLDVRAYRDRLLRSNAAARAAGALSLADLEATWLRDYGPFEELLPSSNFRTQ